MASSGHKLRYSSRRRLAALSFLSNISLDGNCQDGKNNKLLKAFHCDGERASTEDDYSVTVTFLSNTLNKHNSHNSNELHEESSMGHNKVEKNENIKAIHSHTADAVKNKREGKRKVDEQESSVSKICSNVFRERSATVGSQEGKPSKTHLFKAAAAALNPLGSNIGIPLLIPGLTLPLHSDKSSMLSSTENVETPAPGFLLPNSARARRVSSNASEGSHSPTGSGFRDKEVKFFTGIRGDLGAHLADQRLVLVTKNNSPVMIFSTLPFSRCNKLARGDFRGESGRRRHASGVRPMSSSGDYPDLYSQLGLPKPGEGQVVSYSKMLIPSSHFGREVSNTAVRRLHSTGEYCESDLVANKVTNPLARCWAHEAPMRSGYGGRPASPQLAMADLANKIEFEEGSMLHAHSHFHSALLNYHPNLLDDPALWIAGKHSTLLTFPSYMTSVIDYVKPSDLKKELNDKFREKFPHIQLTLSKLRSLKREMRKVAKQDSGADLLTVAQSYVFFEKLILMGVVHKGNRKLCAGASLLLSAKMNDVKGDALKTLIEEIQNSFRVSRKELFSSEFAVLVALEFSLHIPTWEIFSHYQRLLYDS